MTPTNRWTNRHEWIIRASTPLHVAAISEDTARLAANRNLELQMSASNPRRPSELEPHLIRFNGRKEPAEDFEYPPDFATSQAASTGASVGEWRTNQHDYDRRRRAQERHITNLR